MPGTVTGKIKRKFMAHYIDAAAPAASGGTAKYVRLGKDLEEFNVEMNANVDTKSNISGGNIRKSGQLSAAGIRRAILCRDWRSTV